MDETFLPMNTLESFIDAHRISMECRRISRNPNMHSDHPMTHWLCTLRMGDKHMEIPFSMGLAHKSEPRLDEVLDCLASDCGGVENNTEFKEWCSEYGYDSDSRKAKRTYSICQKQAQSLKSMLGVEAYESLLWNTERL